MYFMDARYDVTCFWLFIDTNNLPRYFCYSCRFVGSTCYEGVIVLSNAM